MGRIFWGRFLLVLLGLLSTLACAGKTRPLERYAENQEKKMSAKTAFVQADFEFWAAAYEPTLQDLEDLKEAWRAHGSAYPESRALTEVRRELEKPGQRVVLVALFMTDYDKADLRNKNLGWAVHPVPLSVHELSETDVPLRVFMPVRNSWARYFILRYTPETWLDASQIVVSNQNARLDLSRKR